MLNRWIWRRVARMAPLCQGEPIPYANIENTAHRHFFTEDEVRATESAGYLRGVRCACDTTWFPARGERPR